MNCPSCSTELPDSAKFCGFCGYQMAGGAVASAAAPMADGFGQVPAHARVVPSYDEIVRRGLKLPIGELIGEAWDIAKNQLGLLLGGSIVLGLLYGVVFNVPFGGLIVGGPLMAGLNIVALRLVSGREVHFGNFFDGFKRFVPLMLLSLVSWLLVLLGTVFLVLPGIYLAIAFTWAIWIVIDREEDFWPALMASMKVVNASFGAVFLLRLALFGLNLLGCLACVVGLLLTGPLSVMTMAVAYRRNFGLAGGAERLGLYTTDRLH